MDMSSLPLLFLINVSRFIAANDFRFHKIFDFFNSSTPVAGVADSIRLNRVGRGLSGNSVDGGMKW